MKKAIILFCSITGNTQKVAKAIDKGLKDGGMETTLIKFEDAEEIDYFDYDLVCVGAPSYNWSVPKPFNDYLKKSSIIIKTSKKLFPIVRASKKRPSFFAHIPARIRELTKLYLQAYTWDNFSIIWGLMFWINGISLANL